MCTAYRRVAATKPIAMKEGDVYTVKTGYKIYDRTFATNPTHQADGDEFELLIGDGSKTTMLALGSLATLFAVLNF